ncbi:MAG: FAD-dependent monooxygenase [Actinomycetota bacterium]|nr:FAD-dependent monooxygenase [Actinomycetota bacterium]
MSSSYDVAIVGGRVAGAVLALKLARAGARVVVVDRDELGTDTLSTHAIWPNGIARLEELGVLSPLLERHEVPFLRYRLRVLGHESAGTFTPFGRFDRMIAPRRVALDRVLAEAALEAGAEGRFGQRVSGLLGAGTERDPVRGVTLESGETIAADWTIGADGRASTVAAKLGLEKTGRIATNMSMLLAYWRGLPETEALSLDIGEHRGLSRFPGEDGVELLAVSGPPELTRGGAEARETAYLEAVRRFGTTVDPGAIDRAERITEVRSAPETMLRGYFRKPAGPGWALIGDAAHFKHPATAQGIADAIEHSIFVSDALSADPADLGRFESWRDERAAGHYEFSFTFGTLPVPARSGPLFAAIAADPAWAQDLRDVMTRRLTPDRIFSRAGQPVAAG